MFAFSVHADMDDFWDSGEVDDFFDAGDLSSFGGQTVASGGECVCGTLHEEQDTGANSQTLYDDRTLGFEIINVGVGTKICKISWYSVNIDYSGIIDMYIDNDVDLTADTLGTAQYTAAASTDDLTWNAEWEFDPPISGYDTYYVAIISTGVGSSQDAKYGAQNTGVNADIIYYFSTDGLNMTGDDDSDRDAQVRIYECD